MPRRPAAVTQADIARALRAVQQLGIDARVEIQPNGSIVITPARPESLDDVRSVEQGKDIVL